MSQQWSEANILALYYLWKLFARIPGNACHSNFSEVTT